MIQDGKVVTLAYTLKNDKGEELDRADASDPFFYLHGADQVVPGLEEGLKGLKAGDKKQVSVSPELGYGTLDPDLKMSVKRTQFPADVNVQPGMRFQTETPDGSPVVFTVEKVEDDQVHIDGNHPLAGVTLFFDVEVLAVRDATEDEKSHGHAHDPDGGHGHHH
jgi:FKBP-type peptidyl-prolyl cis-trans isomerase SlyD